MLLLQEFKFIINVQFEKQHANAHHLFQLSNVLSNNSINNTLFDAALSTMNVVMPKYNELIQYLTFQTFPTDYDEKLKQHLILKSALYILIDDSLYKQGRNGILQ